MKKIKLKIGDRYRMLTVLNGFKGNIDTLSAIMEDVKKIRIEDEEWEKAKRMITPVPGTNEANWSWDNDILGETEYELEKDTVKYVVETLQKKSDNNEFTPQDYPLVELLNKLK